MFTVSVSRDLYRYEIHSLIKAFYPEEEVRTYVEEPGTAPSFLRVIFSTEEIRLAFSNAPDKEESFAEGELQFRISGETGTVGINQQAADVDAPLDGCRRNSYGVGYHASTEIDKERVACGSVPA